MNDNLLIELLDDLQQRLDEQDTKLAALAIEARQMLAQVEVLLDRLNSFLVEQASESRIQ